MFFNNNNLTLHKHYNNEIVMKKIAVFGGSFNPVHLGHLFLVDFVLEELQKIEDEKNTKILLLPTFEAPHKNKSDFIKYQHRFHMLRLAFADKIQNKEVILSNLEKKMPVPSYSYKTLNKLDSICRNVSGKEHQADVSISFIMGYDMFLYLPQWKNFQELAQKYRFIVLKRNLLVNESDKKEQLLEEKKILKQLLYPPIFLNNNLWDISSTQIRILLKQLLNKNFLFEKKKIEKQLQSMLPVDVFSYISKNNYSLF